MAKKSAKEQQKDAESIYRAMGYDPVESLVKVAQNEMLEPKVYASARIAIFKTTVPTLKAIEHKNDDKQHTDMIITLNKVMGPLLIEYQKSY